MSILLDYVFTVSSVTPPAPASTAFLKKACLVVKPKDGVQPGVFQECTTTTQVAALTANTDASHFFDAGMNRVFILTAMNLAIENLMEEHNLKFWTLLISSDFDDNDISDEDASINASATIQGLDFEAKTAGDEGNEISVNFVDELPLAVAAFKKIGNITFTAKAKGAAGNDITIELADTKEDGSATASIIGTAIKVDIESGVTTATAIEAALDLVSGITALVDYEIDGGEGSTAQTAVSATNLEGGVTGKEAGAATVTVENDTDIIVDIDDGVTTIASIRSAIQGMTAANALVTVAINEEAEGTDTAEVMDAPINLEDGETAYALETGVYGGVVGIATQSQANAEDWAKRDNWSVFLTSESNKTRNMIFAFGSLLSNVSNWRNQQFISMPVSDGIDQLGLAETLFDERVSFVLTDENQYLNRLAFFVAGQKAIVEPYIKKNLELELQSAALNYIAVNQPSYTRVNASLLQSVLQDVINSYIKERRWLESGSISIALVESNFRASGSVVIAEPKALWRVATELTETNT